MDAKDYLDFALKAYGYSDSAFNFFLILTVAYCGWVVTLATRDRERRFPPYLSWLLPSFYSVTVLVTALAMYNTLTRTNAAYLLARSELGAPEGPVGIDEPDALYAIAAPICIPIILAAVITGGGFVAFATWRLLRKA